MAEWQDGAPRSGEPTVELRHGRRRFDDAPAAGQGWWPVLVLVLLSAVVATIALVTQQLTVSRRRQRGPG